MKQCNDYSLLQHNTFGIDAKCRLFIEYDSLDELTLAVKTLKMPFLHIGQGSNLLFTQDFNGTILHSAIKGINVKERLTGGDVLLEVGSGETWDDVVEYCVSHNLHGAENLSLIPGEAGAAAVQNIGAYGSEIKDIVHEVHFIDISSGELRKFNADECKYAYRKSIFKTELKGRCIIYKVLLRLKTEFKPRLEYGGLKSYFEQKGVSLSAITAKDLRDAIIEIRRAKLPDPQITGNAGSFFMNPIVATDVFNRLISAYPTMPHYPADGGIKVPAGWLIEQCGWKGKSLGNAGVYRNQALVLVNNGKATGSEVVNLCETIRRDVKEKFGITINPEVNII